MTPSTRTGGALVPRLEPPRLAAFDLLSICDSHAPRPPHRRSLLQGLLTPASLRKARQTRYSLYLSSEGTATNLHFDKTPGLLHQLTGRKSVALWPPSEWLRLRPCGDSCGDSCQRRSLWDGEVDAEWPQPHSTPICGSNPRLADVTALDLLTAAQTSNVRRGQDTWCSSLGRHFSYQRAGRIM